MGREFQALGVNGRARTATLFGSYPWVRSHQRNWTLGVSLDAKDFEDRLDVLPSQTDKTAQVAMASLTGEHRDPWRSGGLSHFSWAWSTGRVAIRSPMASAWDAQTAQTDGHYNKLAFGASRLQRLTESVALLAAFNGQVTSRNLDVFEKMMLGDMHSVRAYPEGEAFADEGVMLTLEARKQITLPALVTGQIHLVAFVDAGAVKLNHSPWAEGDNCRHLSGAGVGVYWTRARDFSIKAIYARKLEREDAVWAPDRACRFWCRTSIGRGARCGGLDRVFTRQPGLPFMVVDKIGARVFMFDQHAHLLGAASALLGLTRGDVGVSGIGDRPLSLILPSERTTPSGRYIAHWALNIAGQAIVWVDYDQGISLHPVRSVDVTERRLERLATTAAADNRISYGCINVPTAFGSQVVQPVFVDSTGIVYVMPDTLTLRAVFKMPDTRHRRPQK